MLRSNSEASPFCRLKAVSGLRGLFAACARQEKRMDDDAAGLVRQLCTRAGMIMEDASATAILVGGAMPAELLVIVDDLQIRRAASPRRSRPLRQC
jgi:hypothetical protein